MDYSLENEHIKVRINAIGAELSSYFDKKENKEIIWQADPKFWKRHAPVLFPIVGKVWNNTYRVKGKEFNLTQHGFARDQEFELVNQSGSQIILDLIQDEESKSKYPFDFTLRTTYSLNGKCLEIDYTVINSSDDDILFCIGAHPAFNCPFDGGSLNDYEIEMELNETSNRLLLSKEGFRIGTSTPAYLNGKTIPLSEELFVDDALIFDDLKSEYLKIQKTGTNKSLKIEWFNFPHMGIWKPKDAPFICIEPWQGMADLENFDKEFETKKGVVKLAPNESFECGYAIESQL